MTGVGAAAALPSPRRYRVLAVLLLAYVFNFIDRQVVGILAPAIKADLQLSDTQLGLLGGLAFALLYTTLGIPVARLADRYSRVWIITVSLAVWSGFTALCGLANSFPQLFLARLGVGVGEAGGTAPAYSLISDYFPREQRARALAIYSLGIPIGGALGILFGGLMASAVDWRFAFIAVGGAGVLIAPLLRLAVPDPVRGGFDPVATEAPPTLGAVLRMLAAKPSFWGLSLGAASAATLSYGLNFWLPSFFIRSFGLTLTQTSWLFAGQLVIGGCTGIWLGGWLVDRLAKKNPAAYALVPAICFLISIPFYIGAILAPNIVVAALLALVPQALGLVWLGPIIAAIQHLVPAAGRSTASAAFLFVNNLIGLGCGTLFFGAISDVLKAHYGNEALRYAILSGLVFYVISALLLWRTSRRLHLDLV
ncbi:spinster family MFS transporter [Glacieibacterium sp.]|uniref:spinster family MFS transporter n=1 Tax=Glacieibacterium sp. TaxID=2860237 RepID=UPI003AFF8B33